LNAEELLSGLEVTVHEAEESLSQAQYLLGKAKVLCQDVKRPLRQTGNGQQADKK